ncbi:MAG: malto-oligosyltrehalose synthase [Pseudomonadota bacterium]|nr:malto-oligosyltrehalose synthase [Pseudomonadota bacterium]
MNAPLRSLPINAAADRPPHHRRTCPRATARLQLTPTFGFDHALGLLPYFEALGISHLFVSPILTARRGSTHGYDAIDHRSVNEELGGEPGLRRLVDGLRARDMGLIVDIVPNHMAVGGSDNRRWLDVLEWGRDSDNAEFFDIDWDVNDPALRNRVLAPFLGKPYGEVLADGELKLQFDPARGRFHVAYYEHHFPIAAPHYPNLLKIAGLEKVAELFRPAGGRRTKHGRRQLFESACAALSTAAHDAAAKEGIAALLLRYDAHHGGAERLNRLLEQQHYRLSWWRTAGDEINWRRFFDITGLAALRMQESVVFESVHETIFRLYREGLIDGLRIDHVDGLADPRGYCRRLRARLELLAADRPAHALAGSPYLVVEKILAPGERLARDWNMDGTSGYSFMNDVSALLHDADGEAALTGLWQLHGDGGNFAEEERKARRRIPQELFSADFNACAHALHAIARADPRWRDWSIAAVRRVLVEMLVHFPVYRTYVDERGRSAADAEIMKRVVADAMTGVRPGERPLLLLIDRWLGAEPPRSAATAQARRARLRALARFQQLTSPVAAKSVEDTAFYRHGRLLSRNEVGADPGQFSMPTADFHRSSAERQQRYPHALLATATHDHKRGEDVRTRLSVLSERPRQWSAASAEWAALNHPLKTLVNGVLAPDDTDEYILYQMMVGCWPLQDSGMVDFTERLQQWHRKAVREAKRHSGWIDPRIDYEDACEAFLDAALDSRRSAAFLASIQAFVDSIAAAGAIKSLSQTVLRLTTPGVPDLYQGTEFWDMSMVDPDNRRAVDFDARWHSLLAEPSIDTLLGNWRDGAIKQQLIARCLALRSAHPELFELGNYQALDISGMHSARLLAFARVHRDCAVVIVVPRLVEGLMDNPALPRLSAKALIGHRVRLPKALSGRRWTSWLHHRESGHQEFQVDTSIDLSSLLVRWPVGVLLCRS